MKHKRKRTVLRKRVKRFEKFCVPFESEKVEKTKQKEYDFLYFGFRNEIMIRRVV